AAYTGKPMGSAVAGLRTQQNIKRDQCQNDEKGSRNSEPGIASRETTTKHQSKDSHCCDDKQIQKSLEDKCPETRQSVQQSAPFQQFDFQRLSQLAGSEHGKAHNDGSNPIKIKEAHRGIRVSYGNPPAPGTN